ncbi:LysR family transcriptional regulator [Oligella ureolytica]
MDIKQLRYFTYVAETGSYTRAAEVIDVAQPVLSRQIRRLEIELGQALLIRHGRGVVLTDAGQTLLKHSRLILQQLDLAYEDLNLSDGKLRGHVFLGIPPTLAKLISVDVIKAFKENLPDAKLTIVEAMTVNIEESINLGRVDIGLLHNPSVSQSIENKLLLEEELYLICHVDNPLAQNESICLRDLENVPLIMPSVSNTIRMLCEKEMLKINIKPNIAWEIDSVDIIMNLVAEGMGCAILSQYALPITRQGSLLRAVPITSPKLINQLYLAVSSKRMVTRLHKEVISLLTDICIQRFPAHSNSQQLI